MNSHLIRCEYNDYMYNDLHVIIILTPKIIKYINFNKLIIKHFIK